jgi:hypothetical protein
MKNIPFVIWMLGWPLVDSIDEYLNPKDIAQHLEFWVSCIFFTIWVFVGIGLYQKN